ncbi:MAG: hypothetical protein LBE74_04935 [Treponema sp.]|jgi:hypothetical protein|nr:hypothetical protein [Treponema sp.]
MRKIFTAVLILICAILPAQQTFVKFEEIKAPAFQELTDELNRAIQAALKKAFGDIFIDITKYVPRENKVYYFSFTLSQERTTDFILKMIIKPRNEENEFLFDGISFDFERKDSLISFLQKQLIGEYMLDNGEFKEDAVRQRINSMNLERGAVKIAVTITPKFVFPDQISAWNTLDTAVGVSGFEIKESYNGGEFVVAPYSYNVEKEEFSGDYSSFSPEIQDYLDSLKPQIAVFENGEWAPKGDKVSLKAGIDEEREYRTRYSFVPETGIKGDYTFALAPPVEKTYTVRPLPEYRFFADKVTVDENGISVAYSDSDILIYDIDAFGIGGDAPRGRIREKLILYILINKDMAKFMNENRGNIDFSESKQFDMTVSLIESRNSYVREAIADNSGASREDLLTELKSVMNDGIAVELGAEDIDVEKADWFIALTFRHDAIPDNAVVALKDVRSENAGMSKETIDGISAIFSTMTEMEKEWVNMAKVLCYFGNRAKTSEFLNKYEEANKSLPPKVKRDIAVLRNWSPIGPRGALLTIRKKSEEERPDFRFSRGSVTGMKMREYMESGKVSDKEKKDLYIVFFGEEI